MKAIDRKFSMLSTILAATVLVGGNGAAAQTSTVPQSITTPDKVEAPIGTLDFKDGAPSKATLDKVYDDLDFTHAQRTFADTFQGVSIHAIRKGLQSVGVKDNEAIIYSGADGCEAALADHQCRHDQRHRRARFHHRPHGAGDTKAWRRARSSW